MPTSEQIRAGVRRGIQKLVDRHGTLTAASDRCGIPETLLSRIMTTDEKWGIGISEAIANALGIRLDQLTTGDFKTHAEETSNPPRKT